jgi:hypothetical protein
MTPRHRADRHEDSCSLACEASHEGLGNCLTYVGRHRAEPNAAEGVR